MSHRSLFARFQNRCVLTARNSILMGDTQEDLKKHKKYSGYVVYVAYRLDTKTSLTHAAKLTPMSRDSSVAAPPGGGKDGQQQPTTILEEDNDPSRESSAQFYNGGTFELDDEEDLDSFNLDDSFGGGDGGIGIGIGAGGEEDEKLLEDLEDKQLDSRIRELEAENSRLTEKVWKLEHGKTWVENRLTALEAEVTTLKGAPLDKVPEAAEQPN